MARPDDAEHIKLEDIRVLAERHRVRELPGFISYNTRDSLITKHKGRCAPGALGRTLPESDALRCTARASGTHQPCVVQAAYIGSCP